MGFSVLDGQYGLHVEHRAEKRTGFADSPAFFQVLQSVGNEKAVYLWDRLPGRFSNLLESGRATCFLCRKHCEQGQRNGSQLGVHNLDTPGGLLAQCGTGLVS